MLYGEYPFYSKNGVNSLYDAIKKSNIKLDSENIS